MPGTWQSGLSDIDFFFLITDKDGVYVTTIKQRALAESVLIATNGIKYKKKNWSLSK